MKTMELDALELGAKKILKRDQIKQIFNQREKITNDGTMMMCHYNCVYDDAMGNTHTYNFVSGTCTTSSDCTNTSTCSSLAAGHDWVQSDTCS